MLPYIKYPVLQVRPYGLLVYERTEWLTGGKKKTQTVESEKKTRQNRVYTGLLSKFAQKRLKKAINLLIAIATEKEVQNPTTGKYYRFKVNFITLTLSAPATHIPDKEIKRQLLDVWIKRAKRKFKMHNYVWRAERQKNGNIHFHILSDVYIHHTALKESWNEVQNRLGLIDEFEKKHGHRHPNSTDVHAVHKIKDLAAYMVKYMTKAKAQDDIIQGKLWDCSQNLKTKGNCEMLLEGQPLKVWQTVIERESVRVKHTDHCSIAFIESGQLEGMISGEVLLRWREYLQMIRDKGLRESVATREKPKLISDISPPPF